MIITEQKTSDIVNIDELYQLSDYLIEFVGRKIAICISLSLNPTADDISDILTKSGIQPFVYGIADGEGCKSIEQVLDLTKFLDENGFTRSDAILNVGGGTVCDLGGFVASVYNRGIAYFNLPTTLLCAVDACIGGKTAIDCNGIKNHLGTFWQPKRVFTVNSILKGIPQSLINAGLSEVVKYAVIDQEFFHFLNDLQPTDICANLQTIIEKSLTIKGRLVEEDERDKGKRRYLNAGHTIAHAIESASGYTISHANAVGVGLITETEMAYRAGLIDRLRYSQLSSLYDRFLATDIPLEYLKKDNLLSYMCKDKKNTDQRICFVLPNARSVETVYFDIERVSELLQ